MSGMQSTRLSGRRPMTDEERTLARALALCTFRPGSSAKRLAWQLGVLAEIPSGQITPRQATVLPRIVLSYRRQLPREVVSLAQQMLDAQCQGVRA